MMTREEQIAVAFDDYSNSRKLSTFDDFEYADIQVAFEEGAEWADSNPKFPWISVDEDLPCNHQELTHSNYTDRVLISASNGFAEVAFMCIIEGTWEWETPIKVSHWMPIPKLLKE